MPRGRKPGTRVVDYNNYPFSFRLTDSKTDKRYLDLLNGWIDQAEGEYRTHKIANVIKWLTDRVTGTPPHIESSQGVAQVDVDALKQEIMDDLKGWVRGLIADSGRVETLLDAHLQAETNGGNVPDDVVDNILSDFMNDGF